MTPDESECVHCGADLVMCERFYSSADHFPYCTDCDVGCPGCTDPYDADYYADQRRAMEKDERAIERMERMR